MKQLNEAAAPAANDRVGEAERALNAATHDVELYKVNIADNTLVAPRDGRIQYRIANIGEVLPAGGRVFTMLEHQAQFTPKMVETKEDDPDRAGRPGPISRFPQKSRSASG